MKKTKLFKAVALSAFSAIMFTSCDNIDQAGPNICPSDGFTFTASDLNVDVLSGSTATDLAAASNTVDLATGGLHIYADFGEVIQWEMKIANDAEQKTYAGESSTLDIYWYGQGDKFNGTDLEFAEGSAKIEFEIVCKEMIQKDFTVVGNQSFTNINPAYGLLIRDWDQNGEYPVAGTTFDVSDGWAGAGGGANPWEFEYYNTDASPAGGYFSQFYAKTAAPSWYMGSTSFPTAGIEASLPTTNTDSLYVNFFVKADENLPNCGSQVGFQASSVNYLVSEDITWEGWKLRSFKLSEFKSPSGDPLTTTTIDNMVLQIGSQPEAVSELRVMYDFAFITVGAPLFKD